MARHQWAADRMWEGLMAPSTKHWVQGADAMADAHLTADAVAPKTPEVDQIAHAVHFQANKARLLDEAQRGRAYSEFLVTCAACHEKIGVRPSRPPNGE
jgi:mono/diheme cytochrome c family protein